MKFLKLSLLLLISLLIFISGCSNSTNNTSTKDNYSKDIETLNRNEKHINSKIAEKYKTVNKQLLSYNICPSDSYFYETSSGFITEESFEKNSYEKQGLRKYGEILTEYTYWPDVNPSNIPYSEAIDLVYSVLPDDIKEEKTLYDKNLQKTFIIYSSKKGRFVASLTHSVNVNSNGSITENKDTIVGINYLKEMSYLNY